MAWFRRANKKARQRGRDRGNRSKEGVGGRGKEEGENKKEKGWEREEREKAKEREKEGRGRGRRRRERQAMAARAGLALLPSYVSSTWADQGMQRSPPQSTAPCSNWSGTGRQELSFGQSVSTTGMQGKPREHGQAARLAPSLLPRAAATSASPKADVMLTCRQCKKSFNPKTNGPRACKYHPAHYGGEKVAFQLFKES